MAKPAVVAGVKKLVLDEKTFKKIEGLVAAYGDAVKAQKKAAKGGTDPVVDPSKHLVDLGGLFAKSWAKMKEASGIKDIAPVVKKLAAKGAKPAAKKPAAKKPVAKKPVVKKTAPKPLLKPKM